MRGRRGTAVVLLLLLLASLGVVPAGAAVALPAGKANWVVAVGGLTTPNVNNYRNWVRLGYYVFNTDGTARTNWWSWNTHDEPLRVDTVAANCGGDVPDCAVKTVAGFTGAPMGGFTGTFGYPATGVIEVRWTHNANGTALSPALTERWTVTPDLQSGKAARIASPTMFTSPPQIPAHGVFSDYTATFGIGYGSNAPFDSETRATMTQLRNDSRYNARPYTGTFVVANGGAVRREGTGGAWGFGTGTPTPGDANFGNPWQLCANAQCLGWNQHATGCDCDPDPATRSDADRIRYLAEIGSGRRNTEWYWCQCLAQGQPCYRANSHPRPLLQVIDDDGVFQGWVGVEAFTHVNTRTLVGDQDFPNAYFGVFDMVSAALRP
jgi:hypothetical protein